MPGSNTDWKNLNPKGFLYTDDFAVIGTNRESVEPSDWFVREYSKIDEFEDRATVFEALMTKDTTWWSTRPHLQEKARSFLERAELVFGDFFPGE